MTISSINQRADYVGAGTTGPFAYNFRIFAASDLVVEVVEALTSIVTTLSYPADFSVSGVGNRSGGSITLTSALSVGDGLVIRRVRPLTQTTSLRNQQRYSPASHEDAFDHLMMVDQQQQDEINRSLRLDPIYNPAVYDMVVPPLGDGQVWMGNISRGVDARLLVNANNIALPGDGRTVASISSYLDNNKVFNPLDYGATGNGVADDGAAIRACMVAARAWAGGVNTGPNTFRIPVVDLGGRVYATSIQIEIPGGTGMIIQNGVLIPTGAFDNTKYLMATGSTLDATLQDGFKINNIHIRQMYFNNKHIGGGLLIQRYLRAFVNHSIFQGYATQGIRTAVDGHELVIDNCQLGEYFWSDPMPASSPNAGTPGQLHADEYVGTGIRFETNDNIVTNTVIQLCRYGIYLANSDANLFTNVHIWPGYVRDAGHPTGGAGASLLWYNTAVYVDQNSLLNNWVNCYFDGGEFIWENPWKASIIGCVFLNGQGDAARGMLTLVPKIAGEFLDGVIITGNTFSVLGGGSMLAMRIDTSGGTFSAGNIRRCRWYDNSFTGTTKFCSEVQLSMSQSPAQDWTWDLYSTGLNLFPINVIQQIRYSAYQFSSGTAHFRATALSAASVTISAFSDAAIGTKQSVNATVYLWATMNRSDDA